MANTPFLKSKLFKVIRMTLCGAALPVIIMWLAGIGYNVFGRGQGEGGFWLGLGFFFYIPSSIIANTFSLTNTSPDRGLPDPYIVNSLLVAFVFAAFSIFWQFGIKGQH